MASEFQNESIGSKSEQAADTMPPGLYSRLAPFRKPDRLKSAWQVVNTLIPYFLLWYLMIRSIQLEYSYWWTLMLAVPAAGFLVRIFILFHDCVHGSLFSSKKANTFFGYVFGVLVFTCFEDWRFSHLRHHATYSNLDERGFGDIWTMTRAEYENASMKDRVLYRLYRNPIVLVGLGSLFLFLVINRFPTKTVKRKERMSVLFTNLLIIAMIAAASWLIGFKAYLMIQLPVLALAGAGGNLAVLRAAPVFKRILGPESGMGAFPRGNGRQLILQTSCFAPLVFRKYRVP